VRKDGFEAGAGALQICDGHGGARHRADLIWLAVIFYRDSR